MKQFTKSNNIQKAKQVIRKIAKEEEKSVDYIRHEMKAAIFEGLQNTDPKIQTMWKSIPCKGKVPEPEELIAWVASQVSEKMM